MFAKTCQKICNDLEGSRFTKMPNGRVNAACVTQGLQASIVDIRPGDADTIIITVESLSEDQSEPV